MAAHRYWRIYITASTGSAYVGVNEINFREKVGNASEYPNSGGSAAASSFFAAGYEASKAFDGTSTPWISDGGSLPQWIKYDFGSGNAKDIAEVQMVARPDGGYTQNFGAFDIQYSDDDSSWTTALSVSGLTTTIWSAIKPQTFSIRSGPTTSKKMWRIRCTDTDVGAFDNYFAISEMQMRTTPGGANACTGGNAAAESWLDMGSFSSTYTPDKLLDGSTSTFWANEPFLPAWVGYEFSGATEIVEVTMTARLHPNQNQAPMDFTVEYFDGSAWVVALTKTAEPAWSSAETRVYTFGGSTPPRRRPVVNALGFL